VSTDEVYSSVREQVQVNRSDSSQLELRELLQQSAQQNQPALHQLYRRTSANLFAVLLRILNSTPLAEQALQETYIRIWNRASVYQPE